MVQNAYRPGGGFSMIPPVVKNLLIINALVFVAQMGPLGEFLRAYFALWPVDPPDYVVTPRGWLPTESFTSPFYPWQIITAAFLHGGFGHIFFNMLLLWMFGMRIENIWGSKRFATYYFICVVGASVAQLITVHLTGGYYPTLGASGGVLGVLLAFGMMYPNEPVYLYFLFPIKAKWLVAGLAAIDLFAGVTGTQAGIAHFAHLGGMLTGLILIQYWRGKMPLKPRWHRQHQ
jgi:membrane associated rhomboid family serine protease